MTAITTLQENLSARGQDPGPHDGLLGRKTYGALIGYVAPHCATAVRTQLAAAMALTLPQHGITTRLRVIHFLAQTAHESGGYTRFEESLNYSAQRLVQVWPRRFPTIAEADKCAHNPQALANKVYGGRMGNTQPDDGWRFRGRGILQITGREQYNNLGIDLGLDLIAHPDAAAEPANGVALAAAYWIEHGLNGLADRDDIAGITHAINGGTTGLADRQQLVARLKAIWPA